MSTTTTTVFHCDLCRCESEPKNKAPMLPPAGWITWQQEDPTEERLAFSVHICDRCIKQIKSLLSEIDLNRRRP